MIDLLEHVQRRASRIESAMDRALELRDWVELARLTAQHWRCIRYARIFTARTSLCRSWVGGTP